MNVLCAVLIHIFILWPVPSWILVCIYRNFINIGRFHPFIGHEGPQGEQRYSSTLFLTSALEGGEGSASRPGRTLHPGKTRSPFYRRLGGSQGRSGEVRKISPPPEFDPRTVQPVGSRYTDYATRPRSVPEGSRELRFTRFRDNGTGWW